MMVIASRLDASKGISSWLLPATTSIATWRKNNSQTYRIDPRKVADRPVITAIHLPVHSKIGRDAAPSRTLVRRKHKSGTTGEGYASIMCGCVISSHPPGATRNARYHITPMRIVATG